MDLVARGVLFGVLNCVGCNCGIAYATLLNHVVFGVFAKD